MLLIDGVEYVEWCDLKEPTELQPMIKEHSKDIFGPSSFYFDVNKRLTTEAGIGSIPDAYVLVFDTVPIWYIVEVELSNHDPYKHILNQITRFSNGIKNPKCQNQIIDAIDEDIDSKPILAAEIQSLVKGIDRHKYLWMLIRKDPSLTIIINRITPEVGEVEQSVSKFFSTNIIEFKTYIRMDSSSKAVHAHIFEPIANKPTTYTAPIAPSVRTDSQQSTTIEHTLRKTELDHERFKLQKSEIPYFPIAYSQFIFRTDIGEIITHKTNEEKIRVNLKPWFRKHSNLKAGDLVTIEVMEPMKTYILACK